MIIGPLLKFHGTRDILHADTTMRLRYLDTLDRGRKVRPGRQSIPDLIQIVLQILLKSRQGLPVHTERHGLAWPTMTINSRMKHRAKSVVEALSRRLETD